MTAKKTPDTETLVIDTRKASKQQRFNLIVPDPKGKIEDGITLEFTIKPLGSDVYMKLTDQQSRIETLRKQGKLNTKKAEAEFRDSINEAIYNLVTPNDEFRAQMQRLKNRAGFIYEMTMNALADMVMPDIKRPEA